MDKVLGWGVEGPWFDSWSGEFFFTKIYFKEEMNQMLNKKNKSNNNNSSNTSVFGQWLQTKTVYSIDHVHK